MISYELISILSYREISFQHSEYDNRNISRVLKISQKYQHCRIIKFSVIITDAIIKLQSCY